jgi:hypothetical protein
MLEKLGIRSAKLGYGEAWTEINQYIKRMDG